MPALAQRKLKNTFNTAQAAEIVGISASSLRKLEALNKIHSIRLENGYRVFSLSDLQKLAFELKENKKIKDKTKSHHQITVEDGIVKNLKYPETKRPTYLTPPNLREPDKPLLRTVVPPLPSPNVNQYRRAPVFLFIFSVLLCVFVILFLSGNSRRLEQTKTGQPDIFKKAISSILGKDITNNERSLQNGGLLSSGANNSSDVMGLLDKVTNFVFKVNAPSQLREAVSIEKTLSVTDLSTLIGGISTPSVSSVVRIDTITKGTLEKTLELTGDVTGTLNANNIGSGVITNTELNSSIEYTGDWDFGGTWAIGGTEVSTTADELNLLSGLSSTSDELNYLSGTTVTSGGIMFGNGTYITQSPTKLFWDNTNYRLAIGGATPTESLDITGRIHMTQTTAPDTTTDKLYNVSGTLYWAGTALNGAGGILPGGDYAGQTLYWNGSNWIQNGNLFNNTTNVGIGTSLPSSLFSVGSTSQFQVDSSGNIVKINDVAISFPSSQGAANSILQNNGSGILSWVDPTGTGIIGFWQRNSTYLSPSNIEDNVGIGTSSPTDKLDVAGGMKIGVTYAGMSTTAPSNGLLVQGNVGIGTTYAGTGLEVKRGSAELASTSATPNGLLWFGPATSSVITTMGIWNSGSIHTWIQPRHRSTTLFYNTILNPVGGNVGIGSTGATDKLDVAGGMKIGSTYAGMSTTAPPDGLLVQGRLGIGITSPDPSSIVHVNRSDTAPILSLSYVNTGAGFSAGTNLGILQFGGEDNNSGKNYRSARIIGVADGTWGANQSSALWFQTTATTSPSTAMVINSSGNMGIGTTNPDTKLHIVGGDTYIAPDSGYTFNNASANEDLYVYGNVEVDGTLYTAAQSIGGNLIPNTDNTYDLGSADYRWQNLYLGPASLNISHTTGALGAGANYVNSTLGFTGEKLVLATSLQGSQTTGGNILIQSAYPLGGGTTEAISLKTTADMGATDELFQISDAAEDLLTMLGNGNVGIGTSLPSSLFSVGSTSQFQVDSSGNIVKINNVAISFPSSQGAANSILQNNGSGILSWVDPTGTGTIGFWQRNGTYLSPSNIGDNVGIGTSSPTDKLDVAGGMKIGVTYAGMSTTAPSNGLLVQGNVGIGTSNPNVKLYVNGAGTINGNAIIVGTTSITGATNITGNTTIIGNGIVTATLSAGDLNMGVLSVGTDPSDPRRASLEVGSGVNAFVFPNGQIKFYDTFTEGADTTLALHSPDTGPSWTVLIQSGGVTLRAQSTDTADPTSTVADSGVLYTADSVMSTADYEASVYIDVTDSSDDVALIAVRVQDANNMYVYRFSSGASTLLKRVAGSYTVLGTSTIYPTTGNTVRLRAVGDKITVYRDNTLLISAKDSDISLPGKAGLGVGNIGYISTDDTDTTWSLDKFQVQEYSEPAPAAAVFTGNVGIGITAATDMLDVAGGVKIGSGYANIGTAPSNGLLVQGNVGIGTTVPKNTFDVYGNMAIGTYAGVNTAPSNGLIVSGNVGIGTTNPTSKFHILGTGTFSASGVSSQQIAAHTVTLSGENPTTYATFRAAEIGAMTLVGTNANQTVTTASSLYVATPVASTNVTITDIKPIDTETGAYLSSAGVWTDTSSKLMKENYTQLDLTDILSKIQGLTIESWNYKSDDDNIKHIGPYAEDFYSIFGIGNDDKHLAALDTSGVALAGVKGLISKVEDIQLSISEIQKKQDIQNLALLTNTSSSEPPSSTNTASSTPPDWQTQINDLNTQILGLREEIQILNDKLLGYTTDASDTQDTGLNPNPTDSDSTSPEDISGVSDATQSSESSESTSTPALDLKPNEILSEILRIYEEFKDFVSALGLSATQDKGLVVNTDMNVLGNTTLTNLTITGNILAGTIKIDTLDNSVNVLGSSCYNPETQEKNDKLCQTQTLKLMANLSGNIDIFNGEIILEPNGNVSLNKLILSSKTLGTATIQQGKTEEKIESSAITNRSRIFITALDSIGTPLYIKEKSPENGYFIVSINEANGSDIHFDWLIIDEK